jgi:hypothetical protein
MYPNLKSHSEMHVKGGLLRARFLFVVLNQGPEMWNRIVASLPEEQRGLYNEIAIDNWYPVSALDQIDKAIARELGGLDEKVYEQLGEFSATSSLSGPYNSLLNTDIHSFLTQSALIHRGYQDFGTAKYERLTDNSGLLTIRYETPLPASFCISGTSYFRRAVELCGAKSARCTHSRCCSRGDVVCEFYLTWQD